jgi:hypothetical protein
VIRVRTPIPDGGLDVALFELACRRSQDLGPRLCRSAVDQRHHILQLIAKPVRSAGLVKRRAGPHPASQDLVDQPAIDHEVDAAIGRFHVQRVQEAVPLLLHFGQRHIGSISLRVLMNEPMDLRQTVPLTQNENHLSRLAGRQRHTGRDCRTGIEAGTCAA